MGENPFPRKGASVRGKTVAHAFLGPDYPCMRKSLALLGVLVCGLLWAGSAAARGGRYVLDGGTPKEQAQVRVALQVSLFDWSVVPATVAIHLRRGSATYATRGEIWLDTRLLDSGIFAWGPIQHEYAHQVDFFLLDDAKRAELNAVLHGRIWSHDDSTAALGHSADHASLGAERFASTLAWAYWQSPANSLKPASKKDESAAMSAGAFRALLERMLGIRNPAPPIVTVG
jgi:hypothetical protein